MALAAERAGRFEAWVAPMRPRAAPWRVVAGLALAGAAWIAAAGAAIGLAGDLGLAPDRGAIVVYLLSFGVLIAALGVVMRLIHRLPGARLLGAEERIEPRRLVTGILVVAAVTAGLMVPVFVFEPPMRQHSLAVWAMWLPAALPALLVQTAAEEAVFRGYLQGMLAARFASPLVWWLLPAALFGALHWNPAMGENALLMAVVAGVMGLLLGDVAARSGGLSLPIGLHFANNVFALLVMATPSQLSGMALWLSPIDADDPVAVRAGLIGNLMVILAVWGGWRLIRARRTRRPGPWR